jgi:hypothetical protein
MDILKQAADHLRAGQKDDARKLLISFLKTDPSNAQAWYMLSFALGERNQQVDCVKRALQFNPNFAQARSRLEKLLAAAESRPQPPPATPPPPVRPPTPLPVVNRTSAPVVQQSAKKSLDARKRRAFFLIIGVMGLVIFAGVVIVLALVAQQSAARLSSVPSTPAPTAVPVMTLPPTWTPTSPPTKTPTRTITPTSTPTDFPTLAPPGPTAMAYMLELEAQVMNVRGLDKQRDVPRYVTNRQAYQAHTSKQDTGFDENVELMRMEWAYKALGILTPEFDLVDYNAKVGATGAAAVYVPTDQAIYVFGTHFSGAEGFFYVHEFDHALVDQNFDMNSLGVYPKCLWDSQRCKAIRALVEGDATLLMYLWLYENADYEEYRDLYYYVPPSSLSPGQKQPPAFAPEFNFPYQQGLEFAYYLYERGGWKSINRAYTSLPESTEQILHPEKYLAGERPVVVSDPPFDDVLGSEFILINSDSLGEWDTHLVLAYGADPATQLDAETALKAARGWGGDHYQVYRNLETQQTVLSAHWVWDTQADANEFNQAMTTYQNRRFGTETFSLTGATCRTTGEQVSCLITRGRETIWLLAPGQDLMAELLVLYP